MYHLDGPKSQSHLLQKFWLPENWLYASWKDRLSFVTLLFHTCFHRDNQQDIFNAMGSIYTAVLFIGITNATAVQPVVYVERFVSYRERAAGMYSALPFAFAQVRLVAFCFCFPNLFWKSYQFSKVKYSNVVITLLGRLSLSSLTC